MRWSCMGLHLAAHNSVHNTLVRVFFYHSNRKETKTNTWGVERSHENIMKAPDSLQSLQEGRLIGPQAKEPHAADQGDLDPDGNHYVKPRGTI